MRLAHRPGLVAGLLVALLVPAPLVLAGPLDKAKAAAKEKRWADAAAEYAAALEKTPGSREAVLGLAEAATKGTLVDRYPVAENALFGLLEKKENDREVNLALGELYLVMAAAKGDDQARRFTYEDARTRFEKAATADPKDEQAAVGMARALYWIADFEGALKLLDEFMGRAQSKGPALFWKGQVAYLYATDAYRNAGRLDDNAKSYFQKALGAFEGAVKADPSSFETWMQLGYAAQYLGERDRAVEAYEQAMDLDPQSVMPQRGIEALFTYEPDKYEAKLDELVKKHPSNVAVHFFRGYFHLSRKGFEKAVKSFEAYVAKAKEPGLGLVFLGQAYEGNGQGKKADETFEQALKADPGNVDAAGALDRRLRERHFQAAMSAPANVKVLVDAYEPLLKLAATNPWVANNLAFMLREIVDRNGGGQGPWRAALDQCVRFYVEASKRVEGSIQGPEERIPYATRHGYAGVLNDTGLMFHYYPAVQDLKKAEEYYERALALSEDGYFDAYTNLLKVLLAAERWQDAYDLASACSESLRDADGTPHATGQAHARGVMDKLMREKKVGE